MRIYLMRHATAEDAGSGSDAARALTEQGRREAREAGAAIRERNPSLAAALSSPRQRARETAELVVQAIGLKTPIQIRERLSCGATSAIFLEEIEAAGDGDLLIVAHNPELSAFASELVGRPLSFRPSTVCAIDLDADSARLDWLRHPQDETK